MKNQFARLALASAALLAASTSAFATPITDVQDYSNNTATEYFVDNDSNKKNRTYWRDKDQDWGWTHEAISGSSFSSIVLDISAYDVDAPGEKDMISIFDGSSWLDMGDLNGSNNTWDFTTFDLTSYSWAESQVNAGLQVRMNIDTARAGWYVTLGKATLTIDGGNQECVPTPGVPCTPSASVPESSSLALLGLGLAGLGFARRKQAKKS